MKIITLKSIFLTLLLCITISLGWLLFSVYYYDIGEELTQKYSIFINQYKILKSKLWQEAFSQKNSLSYKKVAFEQKYNTLQIGDKYSFSLEQQQGENRGIYEKTILQVIKINHGSPDEYKQNEPVYFVAKSDQFQQILFQRQSQKSTQTQNQEQNNLNENDNKQLIKLKQCLLLDELQFRDKIHYSVDLNNNLWIISHPHNKVIFIQIYDCLGGKMIKKIFHQPADMIRSYMINQLKQFKVDQQSKSYKIKFLTYDTHNYVLDIKTDQHQDYVLQNNYVEYSHVISSQYIPINNQLFGQNQVKYDFIDPLNTIFNQQFEYLMLVNFKKYVNEIKVLLKWFNSDAKWIVTYLNTRIKQLSSKKTPQLFQYDLQVVDQQNNCVLNLNYNLTSYSQSSQSTLVKLDKYLINVRSAIFHSGENYDQYDIVDILKKEKNTSLKEFKRLQTNQGHNKQYSSQYYYSLYNIHPNSKIHFVGIGEKLLNFYPNEALKKDEFYHVRSHSGGVIFQGSKIKGAYEHKLKVSHQIVQKISIEANQVLSTVYQAHISYRSLYFEIKSNRAELIHGLNGKTVLTHYFNQKDGYQHAGSYLFNNDLWIIEHNSEKQNSYLVKYQLYVDSKQPKQIIFVKRIYGQVQNSQLTEEEDDLQKALKSFMYTHSKGFAILNIFRCIDEFYYVQVASIDKKYHAFIRIHYKRFSNRQPKADGKYSGSLQAALIVDPKEMVQTEQKTQPFGVVIQGLQLLPDINKLSDLNRLSEWTNYSFDQNKTTVTYLQKLNQFEMLPYAIYSHEKTIEQKEYEKEQKILLINMKDIIEKAYQKTVISTKSKAKNSILFFIGLLMLIIASLSVKIILSSNKSLDHKKDQGINKQKQKKQKKKSKQSDEQKLKSQ